MAEFEPIMSALLGLARQARQAMGGVEVNIRVDTDTIAVVENPEQVVALVANLREAKRPLVETLRRRAEVNYVRLEESITSITSQEGVLDQVQAGYSRNSKALAVIEEGIQEGIFRDDVRLLPNIARFREEADNFELILQISTGVDVADQRISGPEVPPEWPEWPEPEVPTPTETIQLDPEQRELLEMIHIGQEGRRILINDDNNIQILFSSKVSIAVFQILYQDLQTDWGIKPGVHSTEVRETAKNAGYQGVRPSSIPIVRLRQTLDRCPFGIASIRDPDDNRLNFYRFRKRMTTEAKNDITGLPKLYSVRPGREDEEPSQPSPVEISPPPVSHLPRRLVIS